MATNIQAYLENLRQPWGQIYYDILFEQLQDTWRKTIKSLLWNPMRKWWPCGSRTIPTSNSLGVWTR